MSKKRRLTGRKCRLTGKSGQVGNRVSHAKNRTKHVFKVNLQNKRIFIPSLNKKVRVKLSTAALRTIDKLGPEAAFKKMGIDIKTLVRQ